MAKKIHRLTSAQIQKLSKPGWYPDGQGLYLQVSQSNTKSWVYRYEKDGKERRHGLGSYTTNTLEVARISASQCRQLRNDGYDPIDFKRQQLDDTKIRAIDFKTCALSYIESHKLSWKSSKHETQWRNSLETYAYPIIGNLTVEKIDTRMIMNVLEPIWFDTTETATRVRQRIETVLDWAKVKGYRSGENPALWRGHLNTLLPKRSKIQKVNHYPAMPYVDLPDYFCSLRNTNTTAARVLALTILTATRTNEIRQATWSEIDFNKSLWVIPENRMKMGKEHRIPLTPESILILNEMKQNKINNFIFPGVQHHKSIGDSALLNLLKQTHPTMTVHGFRSTFRDWCAETTNFPSDLAEAALAHSIINQTQAAYERGDKLDKRRLLMNTWSNYCAKSKPISNVTHIHKQV